MGWLARQFGLACDNVESYTVVTADGATSARARPRIRICTGACAAGVATSASSPSSTSGSTRRPARRSGRVLLRPVRSGGRRGRPGLARPAALAPREATLTCDTITAGEPPVPAARLHGRPVVIVGFVWVGDMADARPTSHGSAGSARRGRGHRRDCATSTSRAAGDERHHHGLRRYSAGHYLTEFSDEAIDAFLSRGIGSVRSEPGLVDDARWRLPGLRRRDRRGRRRRVGVQPP